VILTTSQMDHQILFYQTFLQMAQPCHKHRLI
jgi:hypothetical protein